MNRIAIDEFPFGAPNAARIGSRVLLLSISLRGDAALRLICP